MTNLSHLADLADICETIEAADRNLDAMIYAAMAVQWSRLTYSARPSECHKGMVICYYDDGRSRTHGTCVAPSFTSSIDAALRLIADDTLWAHGFMEEGVFARLCWPMPGGGYAGGYVEATGRTVPLAMCAAALRARSQFAAPRQVAA